MCTLIFGVDVLGPGTVLAVTNRDERPGRPSEPPQVLRATPRVVGGRDGVAGGTWLALRAPAAGRAAGVAMLLNRRDPEPGRTDRRSRGLLTLDVAAAGDPRAAARAEAETGRYAPCSLVWLSPRESWLLAIRAGAAPSLEPIAPGWHALAHHELDDAADPRTAWLAAQLAGFGPPNRSAAERRLAELIAVHGNPATPAVCIHTGPAPTVSVTALWIGPDEVRYRHAAGPSCVTPFEDFSGLLVAPA